MILKHGLNTFLYLKRKNHQLIGLVGMLYCIGVFFVALMFKDYIHDFFILIYPISLLVAYFFVGLTTGGTIFHGLQNAFAFFLNLLIIIMLGLIVYVLKPWFSLGINNSGVNLIASCSSGVAI